MNNKFGKRILVVPDTQVRPGVDLSYLSDIGNLIVDKRPDIIVHLGDHWDMPSLSSYDFGKKDFEGRRYKTDVEAGKEGMRKLLAPLWTLQWKQRNNKHKIYDPEMEFLLGNHENRINKAVNNDAKLEGTIGIEDLELKNYGWNVRDFLEVVIIEGIAFSHYFTTGTMGRPATTASAMLSKKHQSCIAGHQQGRQVATAYKADGSPITAIIAGSCYPHEEKYLGMQGNKHWRGCVMLNEVVDGSFDEMFLSLNYLERKYRNA